MKFTRLAGVGLPTAFLLCAPVAAQYMPHLDPSLYANVIMGMSQGPNLCLAGTPPPDKEIAEARDPAPALMQAYFDAAQAGASRQALFRPSKKASWSHGAVTVPLAAIDAQADPLAKAGHRLDREPLRFVRSGDFQTAFGQWAVLDAAGGVAGVYDAQLQREKGEWKLLTLAVHGAGDAVEPVVQYCTAPGDVTKNGLTASADRVEMLGKEIAKSQAKLEKDRARLAKAEADAAAKRDSYSAREAVRRNRLTVENRAAKIVLMRTNLENAIMAQVDALRDEAEIRQMTLPAREALRLRGFELTTQKEAAAEKAAEAAKAKEEAKAGEKGG